MQLVEIGNRHALATIFPQTHTHRRERNVFFFFHLILFTPNFNLFIFQLKHFVLHLKSSLESRDHISSSFDCNFETKANKILLIPPVTHRLSIQFANDNFFFSHNCSRSTKIVLVCLARFRLAEWNDNK